VLRLAEALSLSVRDCNALLRAAGLPAVYPERDLSEEVMRPYADAIQRLLESHDPYPASASDAKGRILLANDAHRKVFPGASHRTPEQAIDDFFGRKGKFEFVNWDEVAWAYADRWRLEASRSSDPDLARLAAQAESHLAGIPRPPPADQDGAVVVARIRVGDEVVSVFTTVLRFDTAREVTLSEIRVELIFPADTCTANFFRRSS